MKNKFKGFTLMELMVVIAIVAVLAGALIPSATYFIRNAKLKTANAQAKVVFNAALTVSQEYEAKNLSMLNPNDGNPSVTVASDMIFFEDGTDSWANSTKIDSTSPLANEFVRRVNQKVKSDESENCVWAVRYKTDGGVFPVLKAACYSTTSTDRYVGGYPVPTESTKSNSEYKALGEDVAGALNQAETE